ncbi:MAG: DUF4058 family protein, partial [Chloroflexota bacterium]
GRQQYEAKRAKTLNSFTSFVEVDLLRAGEAMPVWLHGCPVTRGLPGDYRILVSRGHQRPRAHLYPFGVRDPIPVFPLPLRSDDAEPSVDLQALLNQVYDRASYDLRIDYRGAPVPPLQEEALWADELLGQQGLR